MLKNWVIAKMKLSISSDYGNPEHWKKLVDFSKRYRVDRLVYWGDSCIGQNNFSGFIPPYLYAAYPELARRIKDDFRKAANTIRDYFKSAYEMTSSNGIEFWYVFQVLQFPDIGFKSSSSLQNPAFPESIREIYPDFLNDAGEVDMSRDFIYDFIANQVNELLELAPKLNGIELWVMERAAIKVARLKNQKVSTDEIINRIVGTIHNRLKCFNCRLDIDLHTAGGETKTLNSLMSAAQKFDDVFVSADNTIGDYHLHLPFNKYLKIASQTNALIVNFDLNGEYWGRNFVPTTAIEQYEKHVEEARGMGAKYVNGRVATENDIFAPHANVLPSKINHYPEVLNISNETAIPSDLRIPSFDTIGCFNAEYFCQVVKNPGIAKEVVIGNFLNREFGFARNKENTKRFINIFLILERTLKKIFYVDKNLYHGQSLLCMPSFVPIYAIAEHFTSNAGTPFPSTKALITTGGSTHPIAFEGWPVPEGHICAGPQEIIREKEKAVWECKAILMDVSEIIADIELEAKNYILGLFEDLYYFARAFNILTHAHVHYFLLVKGEKINDFPNVDILKKLLICMKQLAAEWNQRYPGSRYFMAETMTEWVKIIDNDLSALCFEKANI